MLSKVSYKWNATSDTLVSFFKKEYNLDTAGRIMDISDFVKDTSNIWTKTYKQVYIYDSKENNTGQFGYLWNAATNTGAIDTKYVLSFDENNFNTLLEYFKWDDIEKAWIENQKSEYVYNGMGKTISQIDYSLM